MGQFFEALYDELSVHVKYSAWLDAVLEKEERKIALSREPQRKDVEGEKIETRRMMAEADGRDIVMPEIETPHIIGYLFDVGPTTPTGQGPIPVTEQELRAWQHNRFIRLAPWEVRLLRRLSKDYLMSNRLAEKRDCPAPWSPDEMQDRDREVVAKKIKGIFRS